MSDPARERWRAEHRAKRIRDQKWGPAIDVARWVGFWLAMALALGFGALGLFVEWGWATPAFPLFYLALRIRRIRPFAGSGIGGSTDGYVGGDSGGGDASSGS